MLFETSAAPTYIRAPGGRPGTSPRVTGWLRPAWVEVNLAAVTANVALIREVVAPAAVCAIVKADGYGHGAVAVASAAIAGGASRLGVALPEEGHQLREAGIDAPMVVLSEPPQKPCRSWRRTTSPPRFTVRRALLRCSMLSSKRDTGSRPPRRAPEGRYRDAPGGRQPRAGFRARPGGRRGRNFASKGCSPIWLSPTSHPTPLPPSSWPVQPGGGCPTRKGSDLRSSTPRTLPAPWPIRAPATRW